MEELCGDAGKEAGNENTEAMKGIHSDNRLGCKDLRVAYQLSIKASSAEGEV